MRVDLTSSRYDQEQVRAQFASQAVDKLETLPGVVSVTVMGPGMPGNNAWVIQGIPEGRDRNDPRSIVMSGRYSVNPGALANLGIPLLRGRDFTAQDKAGSPLVAIMSESTARASWPGEDPVGERFQRTGQDEWITVVGLAADTMLQRRLDLSDAAIGIAPGGLGPQRNVFLPYAQRANRSVVLAVRAKGDTATIISAIRSAVLKMDGTLPIYDIALLDDRLADQENPAWHWPR